MGSELYYWTVQDGTVTIMAVRATSGPPSAWGRAEPVISGPFIESQGDTQYDVAPDGRVLVLKKASGSRPGRRNLDYPELDGRVEAVGTC
jgi:hypothetical protein